jgi:hypothetical protein
MDDRRVALVRARACSETARLDAEAVAMEANAARLVAMAAQMRALALSEGVRLNVKADAVLAARAGAGESPWASALPPLFMQQVLELLQWQPAVCGIMRAVCSAWCNIVDALFPGPLQPQPFQGSFIERMAYGLPAAVMKGKIGWFPSVTELHMEEDYDGDFSSPLVELVSLPSLRSLSLPSSYAASAVAAEAIYGVTTLTTLYLVGMGDDDEGTPPDEEGNYNAHLFEKREMYLDEWVLDLSRLTTLTTLIIGDCPAVTDKEVKALRNVTGLTTLHLGGCHNVTIKGLRALRSLPALSTLDISYCRNLKSEELQTLSSLTALSTLNLRGCFQVSAEVKQALRTAIPNLTIVDGF